GAAAVRRTPQDSRAGRAGATRKARKPHGARPRRPKRLHSGLPCQIMKGVVPAGGAFGPFVTLFRNGPLMTSWKTVLVAGVALVLASLFFRGTPPLDVRKVERFRQVDNVLRQVEAHFARQLTEEQKLRLVEDMINSGLKRLDP